MQRLSATVVSLSLVGLAACASGDAPAAETFDNFETGSFTAGDGDDDPSTGDGDPSTGDGDGDPSTGDGDGDPSTGDGDGDSFSCGNGVIEAGEQCDGGDLGGATCTSEGFGGGGLQCTDTCTLDTSNCNACGNGTLDDGEECDGEELGANSSCADLNLGGVDEPLGCTAGCMYDFDACSGCGDGVVTAPEQCEPEGDLLDKAELNGATCESLGFDAGLLDCTAGCTFNTDSCYECGDAVQQGQEECDGADFNDKTCASFDATNGEPFAAGSLTCSGECLINTNNCSLCGDGVISGAEVCDGSALAGETCSSQGFDGGQLTCKADCSGFETAACTDCGDGVIEGNEECDFNNLGGETCVSQGFAGGGTLGCTLGCVLDTSQCSNNFCGDGLVNGMDLCDCGNQGQNCTAAQLDNESCVSLGFDGGTLACNSPNNCNFNTNGCYECGDGEINPGEQCDGNNLGGETCASQGFGGGGSLSCTNGCQFNTNSCVQIANPYTICASPNSAIPTNGLGTTSFIDVPAAGNVTDVNISVTALHTYVGDLSWRMSFAGNEIVVINRVTNGGGGCSSNDINVTLDDEAAGGSVQAQCNPNSPAISGTRTPNQALSIYDGLPMGGQWSLQPQDHVSFDGGTFQQWCVTVTWE